MPDYFSDSIYSLVENNFFLKETLLPRISAILDNFNKILQLSLTLKACELDEFPRNCPSGNSTDCMTASSSEVFTWGRLHTCRYGVNFLEISGIAAGKTRFIVVSAEFFLSHDGKTNATSAPHSCDDFPVISFDVINAAATAIHDNIRLAAREVLMESSTILGDLVDSTPGTLEINREYEEIELLKWTKAIFDNPILGVLIYNVNEDRKLIFTGANKTADRILGIHTRELMGLSIEEAFPPLAETEIPANYYKCATEGTTWVTENIVYNDDRGIEGAFSVYAFQISTNQMAVIFQDITEKKKFELALEKSEEKLRNYIDNAPIGVFVTDAQGRYLSANPFASEMTGYPSDELLQMKIADLVPDEWKAAAGDHFGTVVSKGRASGEVKYRRKNGSFGHWSVDAVKLSDDLFLGFAKDLTEIMENQRQLEAERARSRMYLDIAGVIIIVLDVNGRIMLINRKGMKILGVNEDIYGEDWFQFVPDSNREAVKQTFAKLMNGDLAPMEYYENFVVSRQGKLIPTAWHNAIVYDENGNIIGTISSGEDISQRHADEKLRRQLEEQLNQALKMESIGRLAGGVAHDLNNMLAPIIGYGQLLKDEFPENSSSRDDLEQICAAAERARDITRQLLTFARKQDLELKCYDINTIIAGFLNMMKRTIREDINIITDLLPEPCNVYCDKTQIEQILLNLSLNAQDAMSRGGNLTFKTDILQVPPEGGLYCDMSISGGNWCMVSISDSGPGIPAEIRPHIFEPFFTTKELGKGTGLGLSTVYGIVKQHGGDISAQSALPHGTVFIIIIPLANMDVKECEDSGNVIPQVAGGTETILIVEDQAQVRALARTILKRFGYKILEAPDGPTALEKSRLYNDKIHLLLTDVVMPGINGKQLFQKIHDERPSMKVLFMSGYATDIMTAEDTRSGKLFISKPFTIEGLLEKVRIILDSED
ncbi:PAS domain S-box protein [Myxococcota bacterium]|nr:PAS domain S-box protein [Myxococcota bacterium]MBU1382452.1 PAS domain S-box protein [Myxococcota bacterium]MBU1495571.1 PAS domain S-box protein [Myxococcota bacterium]